MSQKHDKNRYRNTTVCFRMTPAERDELHNRILLCGKTKQDYMIKSTLQQKLIVVGNKKVVNEISKQLKSIEVELERLSDISQIGTEKLNTVNTILEIIKGLYDC